MFSSRKITIVIVAYLTILCSFAVEGRKVCGPNQFRCKNGKNCVAALDVCDNETHCKDESDENTQFCSGNFTGLTKNLVTDFSSGMFKCRFGGSIHAQYLCDGAIDCYDGSDETYDICRKNRCPKKRFRCDYGGCIKGQSCNGKPNCPDGSDETRTLCEDYVCSEGSFKCNYGACIPDSKICDKKPDCLDKSDEFRAVCEGEFNTTDSFTPEVN